MSLLSEIDSDGKVQEGQGVIVGGGGGAGVTSLVGRWVCESGIQRRGPGWRIAFGRCRAVMEELPGHREI